MDDFRSTFANDWNNKERVATKLMLNRQLPDVSYSQRLEGSKKTINAWKSKKKTCALRAFSL